MRAFKLLILIMYFFPYIKSYQVVNIIKKDQWSINKITDGSGNVIEITSLLDDSISNELKHLSYYPMMDIQRKGGWSYKIVIRYSDEEHVLVLSSEEWVKIDGIKFRISEDVDWELYFSQ